MTTNTPQKIILAPMEGVIDAPMRARLSHMGGYSRCVTEFVRVSELLLPDKVFYRYCPELREDGCTPTGTPVYVQLLGSHPAALAANARRAVELGALGIDLNFGCPAKTVNKSQGGSILLRQPSLVAQLVQAVRDAVPVERPVTVKIRLGYDDAESLAHIVEGVRAAGADELAIHARTKFDGYKPPAHWHKVKPIMSTEHHESTIINGEIWSVQDAALACEHSGCRHIMLGRGALSAPDLAARIASGDPHQLPMPWAVLVEVVLAQFIESDQSNERHVGNRTKQWLAYLRRHYTEANLLFQRLRTLHSSEAILRAFTEHQSQDLIDDRP